MLNPKKSQSMLFSRKGTKMDLGLYIVDLPVETVQSTRFLGINLDSKLNWAVQKSRVSSQISKLVGVFSKLRRSLSPKVLIMLYNSFALPYLSYGIPLWGCGDLNQLTACQNRLIRSITGSDRHTSLSTIQQS